MSDKIPVAKPLIGEEERAAVDAVLRSGGIAQGPEVAAFESEFSSAMVEGRELRYVESAPRSVGRGHRRRRRGHRPVVHVRRHG